jgi:two-component system sensor histidine kinase EvgS
MDIGNRGFPEMGLLSMMDLPVYLIDGGTGRFLQVNEAARLQGLAEGDRFHCGLLNHDSCILNIRNGKGHTDCPLLEAHAGGKPVYREAWFSAHDGEPHPFEVVTVDVSDRYPGTATGIFLEYRLDAGRRYDAEKRLADERVLRDQAVTAKSEFLANISHEIRTPLNTILGFAHQLVPLTEEERGKEYLDLILHSGKGLLLLMDDMIDLSRLEAGKLRLSCSVVTIPEIFMALETIYHPQAVEKGIELTFTGTGTDIQGLEIDEVRIRQILGNLIGNAVKFTPPGGMVRVLAESRSELPLQSLSNTVQLSFWIQDSGIGIPEEYHEIIFDPFLQHDGRKGRRYDGTGMGLAISKRLVRMMGGDITVESKPGKGALFSVIIPRVREAPDLASGRTPGRQERKRVLVVDDYPSNRSILSEYLKRFTFDVFEAENGKEALALILEKRPDIVFMDISMPVMDGIRALEELRLRPHGKLLPVVAVTSSLRDSRLASLKDLGFQAVLTKPVSVDEVVLIVERLLFKAGEQSSGKDFFTRSDREIREEFSSLFLDDYKSLLQSNRVDEAGEFAGKLIDFALRCGCEPIAGYGQELQRCVETFDIEKMVSLLEQFPDLTGETKDDSDEE